MDILILSELTEPSINTLSFSFRLTTTGVSNSSLLVLQHKFIYSKNYIAIGYFNNNFNYAGVTASNKIALYVQKQN